MNRTLEKITPTRRNFIGVYEVYDQIYDIFLTPPIAKEHDPVKVTIRVVMQPTLSGVDEVVESIQLERDIPSDIVEQITDIMKIYLKNRNVNIKALDPLRAYLDDEE